MRLDRLRRTALSVAVLSVVGAIASSTGAGPSTDFALGSGPTLSAADTSASGATGATSDTSATGPSGTTGVSGTSGPSGDTGVSGTSGPSGDTGASGTSGDSGTTGTTGTTGTSTPVAPTGASTAPPTTTTTTTDTTTGTGTTSATGDTATAPPVDEWGGTGSIGGPSVNPGSGDHHGAQGGGSTPAVPLVIDSQAQPQTGVGPAASPGSSGAPSVKLGASAPSPSLFSGLDPLSGVLPGSWQDPFIVPGGTIVPRYLIDIYHVPPFLLPIYQSAGTAYGVPWQVLAAINEVETDYGTNLDTSSAGAIGWMQFLPSTWKRYGVDASSSGARDPYNAADAIFAAARYLDAAGAGHNLPGAIWAYNHSWSYVRSVLLRAQLLSGEPSSMMTALSELSEGDFPVQLSYHASYGAQTSGTAGVAPATHASGSAPSPGAVGAVAAGKIRHDAHTTIYANSGAAIVAAQDGTIVKIGASHKLGRYVVLRNAFGDSFIYGHLSSVAGWYPAPKSSLGGGSGGRPSALAPGPRPSGAASAGRQTAHRPLGAALFASFAPSSHDAAQTVAPPAPAGPVPATLNLRSSVTQLALYTPIRKVDSALTHAASNAPATHTLARVTHRPSLLRYFTSALGLRPSQVTLEPLRAGSRVLAGTILGRISATTGHRRGSLIFELRPAGTRYAINARPFLDAWSQLETIELHRVAYGAQLFGADDHPVGKGALLVASQVDLARTVLLDRRVTVAGCERTAIASGAVNRRVLISLELLAAHHARPAVSGAWCVNSRSAAASDPVLRTGNAVAIQAHATPATIGAEAARLARDVRLVAGARVSARATRDLIVISFAPAHQPVALAAAASFTGNIVLSQSRWAALDARLMGISQPRLPTAVSAVALKVAAKHHR